MDNPAVAAARQMADAEDGRPWMSYMGCRFRYASTLGDRYALPLYFSRLTDAEKHKAASDRILTGLPGHDSMRIEELVDGEWVAR